MDLLSLTLWLAGGEAETLKEPGQVTRDHPFRFCRAFAERGPMGSG
jgi:hypothetical protein